MIPKVIHYCWFGRGKMPPLAVKCIESWRKFLPDYEIKEWNEDNFDITHNQYVREAYEARKFAFVTDYVRLYALYHEGGVYMDTDVEAIGNFDKFLHHHAFSGFETDNYVPTGMMAAEKGSRWAKELLDDYNNRFFVKEDGSYDLLANTKTITNYMLSKGIVLNNTYQDFPGLCTMYPSEYFCPKDHTTGRITITENTVCIHHFAGSGRPKRFWDLKHKLKELGYKVLGDRFMSAIVKITKLKFLKK